jgi:hypothetical protein
MLKAIICISFLALTQPAWAETAHSLDQVPGKLKTPEGKATFDQQMNGAPAPDGLGVHLPANLSAKTITDLLVPADDKAPRNLIGAKPWPARPNFYIAIACTGGEPADGDPQCARASDDAGKPPLHVYLGVIEIKDGDAAHLVAKSAAFDGGVSWKDSGLPDEPMDADDTKGAEIKPQSFNRFDLASYKIAPDTLAFGLRGNWTESYSGGGASFESLNLFALDGDRLKPILAVPMSAYKDVAGDWHKDQTRDHQISDGANLLVVSPHSTDQHFDLVVKGRTGRWQRLFRWSKAADAYVPAKN